MLNKTLQILVVEDNKHDRKLYKRYLKKDNVFFSCEIQEVETGEEGISAYTPDIDCLLLDYSLPGYDGLKVLQKLKKSHSHIAIIMLTSQGNEAIAVEAMKNGAQDYLSKNEITPEKLQRAILNTIEKITLQKQLIERTDELEVANKNLEQTLDQLQKAQKKIIHHERMSALGEMASGIAHDFNNALSPIRGYIELLLYAHPQHLKDEERVKKYLTIMEKSVSDATEVVRRMREFYRPQEGSYKPIDVSALVQEAKIVTRPKWRDQALAKGKTIVFSHQLENVPEILGNEMELREMMINLIFNAIDAIQNKGQITIKTYPMQDKVALEVQDDGKGMPLEVQERCFEPFFTTKRHGNSGLGLSISYGIVKRHGGTVDIHSKPEEGTTIIVKFPSHTILAEENKEAVAIIRPLSILVVDDDSRNRVFLAKFFAAEGHTVVLAIDGVDALAKFKASSFDVVLTDLSMPNMKGDTLAIEIKKLSPTTPTIMLTGFGDVIKNISDNTKKIDVVLTKPVNVYELQKTLANIIAKKRGPTSFDQ